MGKHRDDVSLKLEKFQKESLGKECWRMRGRQLSVIIFVLDLCQPHGRKEMCPQRRYAIAWHKVGKRGLEDQYGMSEAPRPDEDTLKARCHEWGVGRAKKQAARLTKASGNIRANVKQGWREFKPRNTITALNRRPLHRSVLLMCIHDCWVKRGKARVWENTHTHTHYRVVNLHFDGLTLS